MWCTHGSISTCLRSCFKVNIDPLLGLLVSCSSLQQKGINGTIPPDGWADLRSLQLIELWENDFGAGAIPFSSWTLPASLKNLSLSELGEIYIGDDASYYLVNGTIPDNWELPGMAFLLQWCMRALPVCSKALATNLSMFLVCRLPIHPRLRLTPIPCILADGLEGLYLAGNDLRGRIPKLPASLRELDLSYNKISGGIPTSLLKHSNLTVLRLGNNLLNGKLSLGAAGCPCQHPCIRGAEF